MSKISIPQRNSLQSNANRKLPRSRWSKIVLVILSLIAIGSLLLLLLPFIPKIKYLLFRPKIDATSYQQAAQDTKQGKKTESPSEKLKGNRLVLAPIGVNAEIIDGNNIYVIGKNQGVWRETKSVDPTKSGNLVLAGHRFLYTAANGGHFYNLPELKIGSKIYITWNEKVYEYEVFNTRTVLPTQVDIRNADPAVPKKLTMYTCFPLGSTAKRYVVEAKQL